jgi:two-component system, NarL family, sensor histidine kinase DesK
MTPPSSEPANRAVRWENVVADPGSTRPAGEAEWVAGQRQMLRGWRGAILRFIPLIYLIYVGGAVEKYSGGARAAAGFVVLAAFCACYIALVTREASGRATPWSNWLLSGLMLGLFAAELPFARAAAFVLCIYLTMIAVARLGVRAAPIVIALTAAAVVVPTAVGSWHDSARSAISDFTPIAIPVVAVVTFVVVRSVRDALELAEARAALARLAAENERNRISRDLHDLLGHSLTTITLKAGLARRLSDHDPERAAREIAEVEDLSRQTLTEVRAAVSSYREVTLASELARGRELLLASGVEPDLPTSTDVVDPAHHELFGWVIREGLTNVARHAHASRCTVRLSADEVEIRDDGVGGPSSFGNGLAGLRERVTAAAGTLDAGPLIPRGWRLRVAVHAASPEPA